MFWGARRPLSRAVTSPSSSTVAAWSSLPVISRGKTGSDAGGALRLALHASPGRRSLGERTHNYRGPRTSKVSGPRHHEMSPRYNSLPPSSRHVPRLALTITEAAYSLGMGETSFKEKVQSEVRVVRLGKLRLIPITELQRFI